MSLSNPLPATSLALAGILALTGCGVESAVLDPTANPRSNTDLICSIPSAQIYNGGPGKDGIPALTNPPLTGAFETGASYLLDRDRVIGIQFDGVTVAVPLNILWWHEIVNMDVGNRKVAVTHCPLTGSSLVFDRGPLNGIEFGVSGLLFQNNLLMYDRSTGESLWPQMARAARCGPRDGAQLTMLAGIETTWGGWKTLHPNTFVLTAQTGHDRDYRRYPYGRYDETGNSDLLFPLAGGIDQRRPPKERVLGIPEGDQGGIAFPFGELRSRGQSSAITTTVGGKEVVIFFDAAADGAMAYETSLSNGTRLTFRTEGSRVLDVETGSVWPLGGRATSGPLIGVQLKPVAEAHVAYWFAWAAFHPTTKVWPL